MMSSLVASASKQQNKTRNAVGGFKQSKTETRRRNAAAFYTRRDTETDEGDRISPKPRVRWAGVFVLARTQSNARTINKGERESESENGKPTKATIRSEMKCEP